MDRKASMIEEEQQGLHKQIAKLIEQIAGISEELATVLDKNKRLEQELSATTRALYEAER